MKTIGLIGGMSWLSTIDYYRYLNESLGRRMGGMHNPPILLNSIDVGLAFDHMARGDMAAVTAMMTGAAQILARAGADLIVLCSNSAHIHAEAVEQAGGLPVIHIAKAVTEAIAASGISRVAVLGTRHTVESGLYSRPLTERGIDTLAPGPDDQYRLENAIEAGVTKGRFDDAEKHVVDAICRDMAAQGAQGLILGCTEIPLMIGKNGPDLPMFDTTRLHAGAVAKAASDPE